MVTSIGVRMPILARIATLLICKASSQNTMRFLQARGPAPVVDDEAWMQETNKGCFKDHGGVPADIGPFSDYPFENCKQYCNFVWNLGKKCQAIVVESGKTRGLCQLLLYVDESDSACFRNASWDTYLAPWYTEATPAPTIATRTPTPVPTPTPTHPPTPPMNTIGLAVYDPQTGPGPIPGFDSFAGKNGGHHSVIFLPFDMVHGSNDSSPNYPSENWGEMVHEHFTCGGDMKLGVASSGAECAAKVVENSECGPYMMYAPGQSHREDWQCRCCKDYLGGEDNNYWNVYKVHAWWLCYVEGDETEKTPAPRYTEPYGYPSYERLKMPTGHGTGQLGFGHDNGKCAVDVEDEVKKWTGYGFDITYSNGYGSFGKPATFDQTFSVGAPGNYVHYSGSSDMMWLGHAQKIYWQATHLSLKEFLSAAQSLAYTMTSEGGYDCATKNCQDFSNRLLDMLHADELAKISHDHMMDDKTRDRFEDLAYKFPELNFMCYKRNKDHTCPEDCHPDIAPECLNPPGGIPKVEIPAGKFYGEVRQCGSRRRR